MVFPELVLEIDVAPESAATVPAKPAADHDGRFAANADADDEVGRAER